MLTENPDKYRILSPEEAIIECRRTLELYKTGQITDLVFDTETTGLSPWHHKIIMFSFAHDVDEWGYSVPLWVTNECHHENYRFKDKIVEVPWTVSERDIAQVRKEFRECLNTIPLTGHNIKFDMKFSVVHNWADLQSYRVNVDTMILAHLVGGGRFKSHALKNLCRNLMIVPDDWEIEIIEYLELFRLLADRTFDKVPTSILGRYAAFDVTYCRDLKHLLLPKLSYKQDDIKNILMDSSKLFTEAEVMGFKLDNGMINYLSHNYDEILVRMLDSMKELPQVRNIIEKRVEAFKAEYAGRRSKKALLQTYEEIAPLVWSPGSPKDLKQLVFDVYNLPVVERTEKGEPSLDKESLDHLIKIGDVEKESTQFVTYLRNHKTFAKLKSTYIDSLPNNSSEGFYRADYNIIGTVTGRLSSGFHTQPKKSDIKRLYESRWKDEGGLIGSFDYSQLELRIVASIAKEWLWIQSYKNDWDLHQTTGGIIANVPYDQVTKEMRSKGKTINFGILYCKQAMSLAEDLGISIDEAQQIINSFFNGATDLRDWIEGQKEYVKDHGFVITPFNRIIYLPDAQCDTKWMVSAAERRAVNYPVQSGASDMVLSSVNRLYKTFKKHSMRSLILGSVHDSIQIDIFPGELKQVLRLLKLCCEKAPMELYDWLICPVRIDMSIGTSWGGASDFEYTDNGSEITLTGSGIRKDLNTMKIFGNRAYDWQWEVLEKKELGMKDFGIDSFVRDDEKWKVCITM